jgi:ABC-type branched-subunit amino acid transport system substrate-binding protein
VTAALTITTLAACSSSGSGSHPSTTGGAGSGSPIKLMLISTIQSPAFGFPEAVDGAKAAAAKYNAAGGVNGHQIQIETCNDQLDPNTAAACAQKAVSEKVSGVITGYTSFGYKIMPILESGKIPFVGLWPSTDTEWNSPETFSFGPGTNGLFAGIATKMHDEGCTKLDIVTAGATAGADPVKLAESAFTQAGGSVGSTITVPPTQADLSPQVAAVNKSGAGCVILLTGAPQALGFITAAHASNPSPIMSATGVPESVLAKLGAASKGLIGGDATYPSTSTELAPMVQALHAYNPSAPVSLGSVSAYSGVEAVAEAGKGLTSVDGASLTAALDKATISLEAFPGPVDFTTPLPVKGWSRLFYGKTVVNRFDGQHWIPYQPVDVLPAIQALHGGT